MSRMLLGCALAALVQAHAMACLPGQVARQDGSCVPTRPLRTRADVPGEVDLPAKGLTPARTYLRLADIPPKGAGAYGVFTLHGKPTSSTRARLMMACQSFVSYLSRQDEIGAVPLENQMLTVWPLDDPDANEARSDDCAFLLDHYVVAAADAAIADAVKQAGDFHGDGPFLIGWSPSDARGQPDKLVLVVDMSNYDTQDSFDHAFRFWKEKIISDPKLWRSGWSLESIRLALRDFANIHGADILSAAHLSDAKGEKR